jgi:hypothetical protein
MNVIFIIFRLHGNGGGVEQVRSPNSLFLFMAGIFGWSKLDGGSQSGLSADWETLQFVAQLWRHCGPVEAADMGKNIEWVKVH